MKEAASLAGYTITGTTTQDAQNKIRAQRRVNLVKADIISRYGGKWDANYKEGWIPLEPLYNIGTATFTKDSRTVSGVLTVWTASMKGSKILGPDGAYYKIASVTNGTTLILTQPFQGTTLTEVYQIWKDEYRLYPEVHSIGGFIDYQLQQVMRETWPREMKDSFPLPTSIENPNVFNVIGRANSTVYSTGQLSGTQNTNVLTGTATSWLSNVEPGFELTIGSYTYHVKAVNSDTELELYQNLVQTVTNATYSAKGKNALVVRFKKPTSQRIVHYWYYAKDYPFVNDYDEDWIAEMFPKVVSNGMAFYDYIDKNDVARANMAAQTYEDSLKTMKASVDGDYTGVRTLGYYIPPEARD